MNCTEKINRAIESIMRDNLVLQAFNDLKTNDDQTIETQKMLCEINAPSYQEQARALEYKEQFLEIGLEDVHMDEVGNVIGYIKGRRARPKMLVSAHLDTVFNTDTDTTVRLVDNKYYAPGITDNSRGLAEVLAVARAIKKSKIALEGTLVFCGNVCEEGLGDLKGIKHIFDTHDDIDGYMTPDGGHVGHIRFKGTGSHRFKVTFKGSGGHSFGDFGIPNPIHALGRAIAKISDLDAPASPKTTYSVGIVEGGISINTISAEARMYVDIRSNGHAELLYAEHEVMQSIHSAVEDEKAKWQSDELQVEIELIGKRPSGELDINEPIVQTSIAVAQTMGIEYELAPAGSTDANVPISLGIPAIQVGFGGKGGGVHTLQEWYDPSGSYQGPQKHLLTLLTLVGVRGTTEPVLSIRK